MFRQHIYHSVNVYPCLGAKLLSCELLALRNMGPVDVNINVINYRDVLDGGYGLVLTASDLEKKAVARATGQSVKADIGRKHKGASLSFVAPHILLHVTGTVGGSTETSVGHLAHYLNQPALPRPAFVILTGICWGNRAKTSVGDVIVSTEVASINHQREDKSGRKFVRTPLTSSLEITDDVRATVERDKSFAVHSGPIGSAELFVALNEPRDVILAQHPDLLGGEMEGYSFLSMLEGIPWIVMKGISDDAGDETDNALQVDAAQNAAGVLPELIRALTAAGKLPSPKNEEPNRRALIDAIIGDSIVVQLLPDPSMLNDHLNNEVGPTLQQRLARYISDDLSQAGLQRSLVNLLLEVVQNALRHGNASRATLAFYETKIELLDDGEHFDLETLAGDRGGAMSWRNFDERFRRANMVEMRYRPVRKGRGNHYTFKINHLSEMLRLARSRCSATIQKAAIGAPGGSRDVLSYDPSCDVLHVNTENVRMFSRSLQIVQAIKAEIDAGKTVYLACPDTDEMLIHERMLSSHLGPKLRIYVAGRSGI